MDIIDGSSLATFSHDIKTLHLKKVRILTRDELEFLNSNIGIIRTYEKCSDLAGNVIATYFRAKLDIENLVYYISHPLLSGSSYIHSSLNAEISRILNSFKIYLDHADKNVPSDIAEQYRNIRRRYYENVFEYRFVYELRNFSQHFDLPIHRLNVRIGVKDQSDSSISVTVGRDKLLASPKSWKEHSIRQVMEGQPQEIEVMPLIWRGITYLLKQHNERVELEFPGIQIKLREYFEIIESAWTDTSYPVIIGPESIESNLRMRNLPLKVLLDSGLGSSLAGSDMREHLRKNMGLHSSTPRPNFPPFMTDKQED